MITRQDRTQKEDVVSEALVSDVKSPTQEPACVTEPQEAAEKQRQL